MSRDTDPSARSLTPDPAYLRLLGQQMERAARTTPPLTSEHAGADPALHTRVSAVVDELAPTLHATSRYLHANPETAYEEFGSAEHLAGLLTEHGLEVERGTGGVETAFAARIGTGSGPTIAICAEYDALPGVGHACGHNVIASAGTGAFLALARLAQEAPEAVPGTVVLFGTPAEEGHTGKEVMARGGAFAGVDAAVMVHPAGDDVSDFPFLGRRLLTVTYTGVAAHASAQPFMGRNALDAASLAYQGIGLLRQQLPPSDRVHAVVAEGGERPNIIPERAVLNLYVRSLYPETLRISSERVEDIVRGAALMAGVDVELAWDAYPISMPVRGNRALLAHWDRAQRDRGREPLAPGVVPEVFGGSTDFGNLSYRVPGIHPMIKVSDSDVALHTRAFAEASGSEAGDRAAVDGADGLARTVLDWLHDPALRQSAQEEFDAVGGVVEVDTYFA